MTFEAVVINQSKNVFSVRQQDNGILHENVFLASYMLFCPAPSEYVLCTRSDQGNVYIVGKIQGEWDDKYGLQLGDMTDNLTVTENGVVRHIKGTNETIIDEDGLRSKFEKLEIEGLGWKITCEDKKITLYTDTATMGEVVIDSPKVTIAGGTGGGLPMGNNYMQMINELKTAINGLISLYNSHVHPAPGGTTSPTASLQSTSVTGSPQQSSKVTCG
jgi:hypothetical protein